jgi:hypothetical protein
VRDFNFSSNNRMVVKLTMADRNDLQLENVIPTTVDRVLASL